MRGYLVVLVDLEVTALILQRSLELVSAVVGCPGEKVAQQVCVALDLTVHHLIDRFRSWSSEVLPLKGVSVSSCPVEGHIVYFLVGICS